jgi:hypothetical protein
MTTIEHGVQALSQWLTDVSTSEWLWYVKYLSANDTGAKANVHQSGPHLGRPLFALAFPGLTARAEREENPDLILPTQIDSHGQDVALRLVWYNSRRRTGQVNGRDEARLTRWGGSNSPMLEPEATGSLTLFAFRLRRDGDADALKVWRCRTPAEEDYLLDRVPDVAPGDGRIVSPTGGRSSAEEHGRCALTPDQIPADWREIFPPGDVLVQWAAGRLNIRGNADRRLFARRQCEEQVFYSVERFHALPRIQQGFGSVEALVEYAGSLVNRRKSRSGRSLELQTRLILDEEGIRYSWQPRTEQRKSPDFIFPSEEAYHDPSFPDTNLRMLAAKTTCKDRWRQILNEADRIPVKHLLTLQEGVSDTQFAEMRDAGVRLVVPEPLMKSYPDSVRAGLVSLEGFLAEIRATEGG